MLLLLAVVAVVLRRLMDMEVVEVVPDNIWKEQV
jgi:hypothetical protein